MSRNILITGASGYLGGTLLNSLPTANLPPHGEIYALVRTAEQAEAVKEYGVKPLSFNAYDNAAVEENVVRHSISIVFWLVDALGVNAQTYFIQALAKVKRETGLEVHFLHTTGAKMFSDVAGAPTDGPLLDNDPGLFDIQKSQKATLGFVQQAINTNNTVIELAEASGVRSYIFAPCIVYGPSKGFGNQISIQTVTIVKAAKALRRVYRVDTGGPSWPVCHVDDNTGLYVQLLRRILQGDDLDHGRNGYYLAASGSVVWDNLYAAIAKALAKRGIIDDESIHMADDHILEKMGAAIGFAKEFVPIQLGAKCTLTAKHGEQIGWKPQYPPEHILADADAEVERILEHI